MNAKWIQKLSSYASSKSSLATTRIIIASKITSQAQASDFDSVPHLSRLARASTIREALLVEAQAAARYWKWFSGNMGVQRTFTSRSPHTNEPVNQALDIGYRYLRQEVEKIFEKYDCNMSIGLFHRAQSKNALPLVYDFMELFRVELIDRAVLTYFRRKKKPVTELSPDLIRQFVALIKHRFDTKRYVRSFKQCETMRYIIELQILRLIKAVNHDTPFEPLPYAKRHENRCY